MWGSAIAFTTGLSSGASLQGGASELTDLCQCSQCCLGKRRTSVAWLYLHFSSKGNVGNLHAGQGGRT